MAEMLHTEYFCFFNRAYLRLPAIYSTNSYLTVSITYFCIATAEHSTGILYCLFLILMLITNTEISPMSGKSIICPDLKQGNH